MKLNKKVYLNVCSLYSESTDCIQNCILICRFTHSAKVRLYEITQFLAKKMEIAREREEERETSCLIQVFTCLVKNNCEIRVDSSIFYHIYCVNLNFPLAGAFLV